MAEQYANLYNTTLAASYTAGSGSISVTSATGAPTTGTFRVLIRDQATYAATLIFKVTSVAGTTFTGVAEGTDTNAATGDLVSGTVLTVGALAQFQSDTIAQVKSVIYGDPLTPPTTSTFGTANSSPNATSIVFADSTDADEPGVILSANSTTADSNIVARLMTVPSAPYNVRMRYRFTAPTTEQYPMAGLCWSDGTKFVIFGNMGRNDAGRLRVTCFSDNHTWSGSYDVEHVTLSGWPGRNGIFDVFVSDTGSNRVCYVCGTGNADDKIEIDSRSNTAYFAPTQIGIFVAPGNNYGGNVYPLQLKVIDWTQS